MGKFSEILRCAIIILILSGISCEDSSAAGIGPDGPGGQGGNDGGIDNKYGRKPKMPSKSIVKLDYDAALNNLNIVFLYDIGECEISVVTYGIIRETHRIDSSVGVVSLDVSLQENDEVVISSDDGFCESYLF